MCSYKCLEQLHVENMKSVKFSVTSITILCPSEYEMGAFGKVDMG